MKTVSSKTREHDRELRAEAETTLGQLLQRDQAEVRKLTQALSYLVPRGISAGRMLLAVIATGTLAGSSGLWGGYAVAQDQAEAAGRRAGEAAATRAAETYLHAREAPLERRLDAVETAIEATHGELRLNRALLCQAADLEGAACPEVQRPRPVR